MSRKTYRREEVSSVKNQPGFTHASHSARRFEKVGVVDLQNAMEQA